MVAAWAATGPGMAGGAGAVAAAGVAAGAFVPTPSIFAVAAISSGVTFAEYPVAGTGGTVGDGLPVGDPPVGIITVGPGPDDGTACH